MLVHTRLGRLAVPILPLAVLAACSSTHPSRDTRSPPLTDPAVKTILREASYEDAALASQNRGRLEVVVRSTDRPTQALPSAHVLIRVRQRDALSRMTDERGVVVFDSLDVGDHEIVVRRIGYGEARAVVPIKRGCRTDAEAYIAVSAIGIAPPPPMQGRVTVTTCR